MFLMFVYVRADWWKSDRPVDGKPQGNWKWNSNLQALLRFPVPPPERPGELARRLLKYVAFCYKLPPGGFLLRSKTIIQAYRHDKLIDHKLP